MVEVNTAGGGPIKFGILMNLDRSMILQQHDLSSPKIKEYFNGTSNCHIYLICKRPRIMFDLQGSVVSGDKITLMIKIQGQESVERYRFDLPNHWEKHLVTMECKSPSTVLTLFVDGEKKLVINASVLLQGLDRSAMVSKYLDLDVLYVGQAYGKDGSRTAPTRLKNHSTLQTIHNELADKFPDQDIWIIIASFEQLVFVDFDPNGYMPVTENAVKAFSKLTSTGIGENQTINLTEAALIKYFQPPFNKIYKSSFPNYGHRSYSECYNLNVNSIAVELNTMRCFNCEIYSETIPKKPNHIFHFTLHTFEEKKSMFEFLPGMDLPDLQN